MKRVFAYLSVVFILAVFCGCRSTYEVDDNVAPAENVTGVIEGIAPQSLNLCSIVLITPADSNGIAQVKWLDPNNTVIDEQSKWFFETYLKSMCDEYIKNNCERKKDEKVD
jgi:hypothetical protein